MENIRKFTVVLGASPKADRYSHMAVLRLRKYQHPVLAIGRKSGHIGDTPIETEQIVAEEVDTVTLYLNADNQHDYYEYILSLKPKRIIFNPGAENEELEALAKQHNIKTMEACTLVLLNTGQY